MDACGDTLHVNRGTSLTPNGGGYVGRVRLRVDASTCFPAIGRVARAPGRRISGRVKMMSSGCSGR